MRGLNLASSLLSIDFLLNFFSWLTHDPNTWIGGVIPNQITNARIQSGDSVFITAEPRRVNNLTIEAGGVLNSQGFETWIYGDYALDGIHYGTGNDNIEFRGGEATLSGTGSVLTTGRVLVQAGNKTFDASTDLYFQNGFYINPNLIITNHGTVSINYQLLGGNASSTWINLIAASSPFSLPQRALCSSPPLKYKKPFASGEFTSQRHVFPSISTICKKLGIEIPVREPSGRSRFRAEIMALASSSALNGFLMN